MQYLVKRVRLRDSNNGTVARHIRDRLGREGMAPVEAERRAVACDRDRGEMKEDTASIRDGHKGCADAKLPNIWEMLLFF